MKKAMTEIIKNISGTLFLSDYFDKPYRLDFDLLQKFEIMKKNHWRHNGFNSEMRKTRKSSYFSS
jgi:hypothetical protein